MAAHQTFQMDAHLPLLHIQADRTVGQFFSRCHFADFIFENFAHNCRQLFHFAGAGLFVFALNIKVNVGIGNMLDNISLIIRQSLCPKLINRIRQQQNLNPFGLKRFQLRIVRQNPDIVAGNVINGLLLVLTGLNLLGAFDIIVKRSVFFQIICRNKTRQTGNFFAIGKIFINSFFESRAESLPENQIIVIVFRPLLQLLQQTLDRTALNFFQKGAVLQHLARNIQRQIRTVNHAFHKTQIVRHQLLNLV